MNCYRLDVPKTISTRKGQDCRAWVRRNAKLGDRGLKPECGSGRSKLVSRPAFARTVALLPPRQRAANRS